MKRKHKLLILFLFKISLISLSLYAMEVNLLGVETPGEKNLLLLKIKYENFDGNNIKTQDNTLLIETVKQGFYSSVEYLLSYNCFVTIINESFDQSAPPLFWALVNGNKDITELLLRNGANPNFKTEKGLSAYESIDEFVTKQFITQMKADELKQILHDFGYGADNWNVFKVGNIFTLKEEVGLRAVESISSTILSSLKNGTIVKVSLIGRFAKINGMNSRWVYVEVLPGTQDKDGKLLEAGLAGWCFGGYLK